MESVFNTFFFKKKKKNTHNIFRNILLKEKRNVLNYAKEKNKKISLNVKHSKAFFLKYIYYTLFLFDIFFFIIAFSKP